MRFRKLLPIAILGVIAAVIAMRLLASEVMGKAKDSPRRRAQPAPAFTVPLPPVQVFVAKRLVGARIEYRYRVANGSAFPISDLLVGYSDQYATSELKEPPGGWDVAVIPESTYASPTGWQLHFTVVEGESLGHIQWFVTDSSQVVLGGQSLSGFTVNLPRIDSNYESGHWTALTTSTEERIFTGSIEPDPTTAVGEGTSLDRDTGIKVTPVPSSRTVRLSFVLPQGTPYEVTIYDVRGRLVRRVERGKAVGTSLSVPWDAKDFTGRPVASGMYFARVKIPQGQRFARIVITR